MISYSKEESKQKELTLDSVKQMFHLNQAYSFFLYLAYIYIAMFYCNFNSNV